MRGHPVLGCIADDFSGGTDLGNALAREGLDVIQTVGLPEPDLMTAWSDAIIVALKSRTAPLGEAVAASSAALDWLRGQGVERFYFKYCSTFDSRSDGNIGPVADMLLDELDASFTIACPAFPETGRTVYQGHLFVGDRLLAESPMARHPLTPMTDSSVVRLLARQTRRPVALVPAQTVARGAGAIRSTFRSLASDGVGFAVVDAMTDGDLREIATAVADHALVTGASGLARGLPSAYRDMGMLRAPGRRNRFVAPRGATAILSGSASVATREQVRSFREMSPAFAIDPRRLAVNPSALDETIEAAIVSLDRGPVLVHAVTEDDEVANVQRELGVERSAGIVEEALATVACRLVEHGVRRLVVAGGETSGAVVKALGIGAFRIGPEIAPGVPWCETIGEPHLALALKSGNFGSAGFFFDAVKALG
jgi:uncharacterized protein YgbK (DUF1537 family)